MVFGFEWRDLHPVRFRVEPKFEAANMTPIFDGRIGMGVGGIVSDLRPASGTAPQHAKGGL